MARPRQISNEQILSAMRTAVMSDGPTVSLEQVASGLGVTAPALLKRFGSRDALLIEALRPPDRPEWVELLIAGPTPTPDFRTQMLDIFVRMSEFMSQVVPCMMALRESGISHERIFTPDRRPPEVAIKGIKHWLDKAHELGLTESKDSETTAFAILGSLQTRAFFAHVVRKNFSPASERRYLEQLADMFCRALGVRPPSKKSRSPRRKS